MICFRIRNVVCERHQKYNEWNIEKDINSVQAYVARIYTHGVISARNHISSRVILVSSKETGA